MGAAVFQGGLFGLSAQFPSQYLSAVLSGQALGAVFACLCRSVGGVGGIRLGYQSRLRPLLSGEKVKRELGGHNYKGDVPMIWLVLVRSRSSEL